MPEGPQVQRTANLIRSFVNSEVVSVQHPKSRPPWPLKLPTKIIQVNAVGKNIFIYLADGSIIYNHMLMWGGWRATCQTSGKKRLNTCFKTTAGELGYFGGGILKLINKSQAREILSNLGPELVDGESAHVVFKLVANCPKAIGEALLDQRLVAGIGNIYKSEGLFVARISPTKQADQVKESEYTRLFNFLKMQMTQDIKRSGPITTTTPEVAKRGLRNFVYKRYHQPCLFCGTKVERIYQGSSFARSTYFCPRCQNNN